MPGVKVLVVAYHFFPDEDAEAAAATVLLGVTQDDLVFDVFTASPTPSAPSAATLGPSVRTVHVPPVPRCLDLPLLGTAFRLLRFLGRIGLRRYACVYSRSMPPFDHLVALLYTRFRRVPWIAYFSDPWLENPYRLRFRKSRILQRAFMLQPDVVVVTNDNFASWLRNRYPRATVVTMPHPIPPAASGRPAGGGPAGRRTSIAHIGRFYDLRTPDYFLRLLPDKEDVQLSLVGTEPDDPCLRSCDPGTCRCLGTMPAADARHVGAESDFLLCIDADTPQAPFFLPSKIALYLSMRRPVIFVTYRRSPVHRLFCRNEDFMLFYEDGVAEGRAKLQRILGGAVRWDDSAAERYRSEWTPEALNARLAALIAACLQRSLSRRKETP